MSSKSEIKILNLKDSKNLTFKRPVPDRPLVHTEGSHDHAGEERPYNILEQEFCQAQPSPNQSWAEVALVPIDPAAHPPAGKVDTSLRYKSNYVKTVSTI